MNTITVKTSEKRFPVAPDLYGLFFEDISHAGDGGLYPEMIRNRSFEDSIIPEGCVTNDGGKTFVSPTGWVDEFNNGEGMDNWVRDNRPEKTPVPAWYSEGASFEMNSQDTLNKIRKVSLDVTFEKGGLIFNTGYAGIPQEEGRSYRFMCFAKAETPAALVLRTEEGGEVIGTAELCIDGAEWKQYEVTFTAARTTGTARFAIVCPEGGHIRFGFSSLMPVDTYLGHGLRKDLVEKLRDMHPGFMRFPGGCIVEGFTMETAMFFRKTVGPIWERPTFWLLWHYRTTNGLGFHEYLQLCEDINVQPMFVCNCGMTCQGRQPYYFNDEEFEDIADDTMNALEYALGDATTKWGALRAEMGHPAPFRLKYLEIGNENNGPEYISRFLKIRERVSAKYPELIIVSNSRDDELKADIVDDHYYNMPEFYAENVGIYDSYDRSKPDVFVGEFSVNQSYEGQLRAAVSEAMFMVGFERNQDKVKLCSYAPLFEHVHYSAWYPNLIIYDNYRSYGIPSYYAFKLFGRNRGANVVVSEEQVPRVYRKFHGLPMLVGSDGTVFRNSSLNGQSVSVYKELFGNAIAEDDTVTLKMNEQQAGKMNPRFLRFISPMAVLGEEKDLDGTSGVFETEVKIEAGKEVGIGVLCAPRPLCYYERFRPDPTDPWTIFNLENLWLKIADGKMSILRKNMRSGVLAPETPIDLPEGEFVRVRAEYSPTEVRFFINGTEALSAELPSYQCLASVATDSDDEVIVKVVNFTEESQPVRILLDCDVEDAYTVEYVSGTAEDENSLEAPEAVSDVTETRTGASRDFVLDTPAMSINVAVLKKLH